MASDGKAAAVAVMPPPAPPNFEKFCDAASNSENVTPAAAAVEAVVQPATAASGGDGSEKDCSPAGDEPKVAAKVHWKIWRINRSSSILEP